MRGQPGHLSARLRRASAVVRGKPMTPPAVAIMNVHRDGDVFAAMGFSGAATTDCPAVMLRPRSRADHAAIAPEKDQAPR